MAVWSSVYKQSRMRTQLRDFENDEISLLEVNLSEILVLFSPNLFTAGETLIELLALSCYYPWSPTVSFCTTSGHHHRLRIN